MVLGLGLELFPELEAEYKLYNVTRRRMEYGSFSGYNSYPNNVDWIYSGVALLIICHICNDYFLKKKINPSKHLYPYAFLFLARAFPSLSRLVSNDSRF